jgi:hypothetical protein
MLRPFSAITPDLDAFLSDDLQAIVPAEKI